MHRARRIVLISLAVVLVGAVALLLRALDAMGLFTEVKSVACNDARIVRGITGAEDMQYDVSSNSLFISATDRRAWPLRPAAQDGIYIYRPGSTAVPEKLHGTPSDFHPLGLSIFRPGDGSLTLFAVNYPVRGKPVIDIFDVVAAGTPDIALHERESVAGGLLTSPNDVVAVDKDRFYATNDHGSITPLGRMLEDYLMLPRANVVYFDGSSLRIVAQNLEYANGINRSSDGSFLYVAETTGREIRTYARDTSSGDLAYMNSIPVASGLDNIDVSDNGEVFVAGHPSLFDLLAYRRDPSKSSPSQVFRLKLTAKGDPQSAEPVYSGKDIGAASVGVVARNRLYIGSVFDAKILSCAL